ncbi:hypothetical protein MUK42_33326 [Musa troglodytarum]|uniref:DUF547 domain-containing protein n=1 Tax=Musa troglodytarum TaxID=320322 RepID=A0A9E7EZU0_9LILI|nr:hypothetical protein MUK42_33326 [Musa troglodytarum]
MEVTNAGRVDSVSKVSSTRVSHLGRSKSASDRNLELTKSGKSHCIARYRTECKKFRFQPHQVLSSIEDAGLTNILLKLKILAVVLSMLHNFRIFIFYYNFDIVAKHKAGFDITTSPLTCQFLFQEKLPTSWREYPKRWSDAWLLYIDGCVLTHLKSLVNCILLLKIIYQCCPSSKRLLVEQLENVNVSVLETNAKLAFWINIYNSLPMHWLETILTNAVRKKYGEEKQLTGSNLGLSSCQLLVFFALCTGASSDPMVRTYTRKNAMEELEKAKRGIPSNPCTGEEIKQSFSTKGSR